MTYFCKLVLKTSKKKLIKYNKHQEKERDTTMMQETMDNPEKRFAVGFSFPGAYRDRVKAIADFLSEKFSQDRILYDEYFKAEFARPNLDTYLQELFENETELVVVFLCQAYDGQEWCGLEWRAIRSRINEKDGKSIMFLKLDNSEPAGFFDNIDGSVEISSKSDKEVAELIIQRYGFCKNIIMKYDIFNTMIVKKNGVNEEKRKQITWKKECEKNKKTQQKHRIWWLYIVAIAIFVLSFVLYYQHIKKNSADLKKHVALSTSGDTACISIDLGLPSNTLWGDRNIGAKDPYSIGNFYSWGVTIPIEDNVIDYENKIRFSNIRGTEYDVAFITLGQEWALPTNEQFMELISACKWDWTVKEGKTGYTLTGPNGNQLYFPVAGIIFKKDGYKYNNQYGYYWTSESYDMSDALELIMGLDGVVVVVVEHGKKYVGRSVRPVYQKQ